MVAGFVSLAEPANRWRNQKALGLVMSDTISSDCYRLSGHGDSDIFSVCARQEGSVGRLVNERYWLYPMQCRKEGHGPIGTVGSSSASREANFHSRPIGARVREEDDRVWPDPEADDRSERDTSRGYFGHGRHSGHEQLTAVRGVITFAYRLRRDPCNC